jgi:hypothetical protein
MIHGRRRGFTEFGDSAIRESGRRSGALGLGRPRTKAREERGVGGEGCVGRTLYELPFRASDQHTRAETGWARRTARSEVAGLLERMNLEAGET